MSIDLIVNTPTRVVDVQRTMRTVNGHVTQNDGLFLRKGEATQGWSYWLPWSY